MKKNGFTLIELLAVIVILGLIMAVTAKDIIGVIENSKMKATKYDVAGIFDDLSNQIHSLEIENKDYAGTYTVKDGIILEENNFSLEMKSNYNGIITINDDKEITSALGDSRYCVSKNGNYFDVLANEFENKNCILIPSDECFHLKNGVLKWYGETRKNSTGNFYIDNGICETDDLIIPNYVNGEKIVKISTGAFEGFYNLNSLVLPDTLEIIENETFSYLHLNSVEFGNSLMLIGELAFAGNNISTLNIPETVEYIGKGAFNLNLLPDDQAFIFQRKLDGSTDYTKLISYGGARKENVLIPNGVNNIEDCAFSNMGLKSVTIPNSITSIGNYAFDNNYLTSVIIPNSVTNMGNGAFADNNLTSVIIPNSVTKIGEYAFLGNRLTSVTIPNSVTKIGENAFAYNELESFIIPNSVTNMGKGAFANNNLTSVIIPDSVTSIGEYAFHWNELTSVTIPDSVTSIGEYAFCGNRLTSVTIPNSVTSIGGYAFYKSSDYNSNNLLNYILYNGTTLHDWNYIINGINGIPFTTGTVTNTSGNVTISAN